MFVDLEVFEKYRADGLLLKQTHPTKDLAIWNYTRKTQYDQLWDEITLMCRGLITNSEGRVIAHCMPKFFNLEELTSDQIPNEPFELTEKMDGSFGNVFYYGNEWELSSRGSFTSDQAIKGNKILKECNTEFGLYIEYSYIVEIIYPENKIVVNYGDAEKLVVITCFNVETGKEGEISQMTSEGWEIVKKYDGVTDYNQIKALIKDDAEGMVARFYPSGFRMKVKGDEYFRLHKIVTNVSSRDIWEILKYGRSVEELLDHTPDEFDEWVRSEIKKFQTMFDVTLFNTEVLYYHTVDETLTRKEIAEAISKKDKSVRGMLFALYDGYDITEAIWDKLYPPYYKPTTKREDNV
jgi:RNA ligase